MPSEYPTSCDTHQDLGSVAVSAKGANDFNAEDYKDDLGVETLSEQQVEMLRTLWNIMTSFVDLGWGVDTVQLFLPDLFAQASREISTLPPSPAHGNDEECTES
tara:strand:+ start:56 stop:367 length:312 start_codon:yes stop_codon:yes gene_type:complete